MWHKYCINIYNLNTRSVRTYKPMKTTTASLVLFFAFLVSAFAKGCDYGLRKHDLITGAKISVDGLWINYNGSLYHYMNVRDNSAREGIFFEEPCDIVGATISMEGEYVDYNRCSYQKFRTDWVPAPTVVTSKEVERSPAAVIGFAACMGIFFGLFLNATRKKR